MTSTQGSTTGNPIRTMVVDDSAVIRGLISRMLEADPEIEVVASVGNGQLAVNQLERQAGKIDVIILDIEMPVMDGLTALPLLIKADPNIKIIMASTLTKRNAEISLRAMTGGASDYVPKPTSSREMSGENDFRRELTDKVKSLGTAHRRALGLPIGARSEKPPRGAAAPVGKAKTGDGPQRWEMKSSSEITLRQAGSTKADILAIGSSTGGPQALFEFLKGLPTSINVPVVITQHMPATFTAILAEHITRMTSWPCREGKDGDVLEAGKILLAPGDFHMTIVQKGTQRVISLNQDPPENFCRPAVDPMLRSVVKVFGPRVLTVILTGMGNDGAKGATGVVEAGGNVIAQDEETSVVWGMPGAVASAGICSAVLPVGKLAAHAVSMLKQGS